MDKGARLLEFFKGDKRRILTAVLLVFGLLLMVLSASGGRNESTVGEDSLAKYKRELEQELSELCSSIEGVGRCEVRVSFSEGARVEYKGTSKVCETPPKVQGITVVCDGGARSDVRAAITECLVAMFDIGANRVAVVKRS